MSKVVTMIPVRMASTRLPNKPLLDVNGKSILQRVYENVKACVPGDIIIAAADIKDSIYDTITNKVFEGYNWTKKKLKGWFADGTTDAPGGLSMVNEEGTELMVTPFGTLTSLPAHTGIIPADLTKSLYHLGEVAPNLIQETYHSSQDSLMKAIQNSQKIEDNSVNIQKLDAVFQVNENFDFDRFLTEVRGVVNTTKHNR